MENNLYCPSHKCNIMELLPVLMDINTKEEITLSPSQLNHELQMSTEERLAKLCKSTRKYRVYTEVNTFSRTPDIIIFQNFAPRLTYKTTLSFLNLHSVSRHLRVISGNSPYFEVDGPTKDCSARLAPGMSYTVNVTFLPSENRNYIHHISIMTDTESFNVPVYGLGSVALLNLPDEIKMPSTVINVASEKSMILHNYGKSTASFVISSKGPFSVIPNKHNLLAGKFLDIKITCKSSKLGHITDFIQFSYDDIKLKIPVECQIYDIHSHLDKDIISFEDIYMGLQRQDSVTVHNCSNHFLDFKWKLHKSFAMDLLENSKMVKNMEGIRELEKKRCNKLERMSIIDYEGHSRIYDKLFQDEVAEMEEMNNLYLYDSPVFNIMPLEGKILPNKSQTFIVTFAPNKNEHYESWAYLDVTGQVERLPLKLRGAGRGPYVSLNVKVLNIGDVFLCATHNYEIAVKNEGNIPATVVFKESITDFDATIKCIPRKLHLYQQDTCRAFILSFYSELKGAFIETIKFVIKESEEVLQFVLTGNVVCPLLKLNIRELDFGEFPFGEQQRKEFLLVNSCQVPIEFKIFVEGHNIDLNEINFDPNQGIVDAYTNITVVVQLNSCRSKKVEANIKVIMWGSEQYAISIPLKLICISPKIKCYPSEIRIKFCFLNFDYKRIITLKNEDSVPGLITYTPSSNPGNSTIQCVLAKTEFVLDPHELEEIELSIKTNTLGISHLPLYFTVAGTNAQELCTITIDGQGPVVSYRPDELQFNQITLLQTVTEELTLINDSPISAIAHITKGRDSFFELDTEEMEIMPDEEKSVLVTCYLTDVGKYSGIINVSIHNGESIDVKVLGQGVGHSILCEPKLDPEYEAGILLTYQHFSLPVKITNLGRRNYRIRWTSCQSIKNLKDKLNEYDSSRAFRIKPEYFELSHRAEQTVEIQGHSKHQRQAEEEFFCYALIDKSSKMELVMSFIVKASFVEPSVSITKPVLDVLVADNDCPELEDQMSVVNDLSVAVDLNVCTNNEYFIVHRDKSHISYLSERLNPHAKLSMMIKFLPSVSERRYFKRTGEVVVGYLNHPNSVKLEVNTEVCFPTISLDETELEFNCVPLNSYTYKKVIVKNITFLPAKYSWEILEEFFEIENLPAARKESIPEVEKSVTDFLAKPALEQSSTEVIFEKKIKHDGGTKSQEKVRREKDGSIFEEQRSIRISWKQNRYENEMKKILLPTLQKFMDDSNEQDLFGEMRKKPVHDGHQIRDILSIEPYEGQLEPYEYGIITIGFFPPPNTKIKAKVICKVQGGEHEPLSIVGISSKISYAFDKKYVEFGCKLFCEVCENTIVLTNNGFCEFTYTINCDTSEEVVFEPGWLNVIPRTMKLNPHDNVTLKIKYFPGIVGEFNGAFTIVIGYLEPFEIKIHGYAVFSQVFMHIPRPLINQKPSALLYGAICTLSKHYMESLEDMHAVPANRKINDSSADLKMLSQQMGDEWVVISQYDAYPSTMDIDMSLERLLLEQYLPENAEALEPHILTHAVKEIPGFEIPAYLLDFGHVIVERAVCYTVLILNYGPITTDIRLVKDTVNLDKNKFKIEYQPKKLKVGETTHLYVIFHPTLKRYPELDEKIKEKFYLIVSHGATIPIEITATVTIPRLSFEHKCIDFGAIHVGYCLRKSVMIKNDGHVLSKWSAECKKKHVYFVRPTEGQLLPGKRGLLDIYFKPTVKDFLPGKLKIYIEGSPHKTTVDLYGYGIESNMTVNPTDLNFNSTLPFSQNSSIILRVQNISTSPVEFCFADFDKQYQQEKLWINTYFNSHYINYMLIPRRNAGEQLHNIFQDNYVKYADEIRKKLMRTDKRFSDSNLEHMPTEDPEDPLLKHSPTEIEKMINDYLESKQRVEDSGSTDVHNINEIFNSNITVVEPEVNKITDTKKSQSGIFIVFHGGPNTDYFKAANRAGRKLKVPVYSIDRLIYETLLEKGVKCADNINILINEMFDCVATTDDLVPIPEEDEYDALIRKVYVTGHNKMPKHPKKMSKIKEKSSKTSEKSLEKQVKKEKEPSTLANIPMEMFEDLLKYKFKSFDNGVIIESLHSDFLRKINTALYTILCAVRNSKYIHVIILSNTLQDHIKYEGEKLANEEAATAKERLSMMQRDQTKSKTKAKNSQETSTTGKPNINPKMPKNRKPSDLEKFTLKHMDKEVKVDFETFQDFLNDVIEICHSWDKREMKGSLKPDTEPKDFGKDMKATQQKKNKSAVEENLDEHGIPLWIINNANSERLIDFSDIVSGALQRSSELEEAKQDLSEKAEEEDKESSVVFTILTKLHERDTNVSDFFVISNYEPAADKEAAENKASAHSSDSLLTTGGRGGSKKKTTKHFKRSSEKSLYTLSRKENEVSHNEFIPRYILQPDEIQFYLLTFSPKTCGQYDHNFLVHVTGSNSNYLLRCSGRCELPTIDLNPYVLFPNVLESYRDKVLDTNFAYIKEMNVLDFGLVIVDSDKPYKYECNLLLKNISNLPCEIKASLGEKSPYNLPSNKLTIYPAQEANLPVSIKANRIGLLQSNLCISTKNNPISHVTKLITKPCKLDFQVKPKAMSFDKVPINCTLSKKLTLTNQSPINLLWKFVDIKWALSIFEISKIEGTLGPFSVFDVIFSYSPLQEETCPKKQIGIQVFDPHHSVKSPLYVDYISLHADPIEYLVEYNDHIDLGDIKGRTEYKIPFNLMNKGQCNISIMFVKIDNPLDKEKHIRKYFELKNTSETIYPNKLFTGTLIFKPPKPMEFKEVSLFACNFIESTNQDNVLKSFVMKVSARVFLSRFEITPATDMNLGYQQIHSTKKHMIEIRNTGKFPFEYSISSLRLDEQSTSDKFSRGQSFSGETSKFEKGKKDPGKKSKEGKDDKRVKDTTRLTFECFSIESAVGNIMPNETAHVEIDCTPKENKEYKETLVINVSESHEDDEMGRQISLSVIGCEPLLNFYDRKIFREQYITDKLENLSFSNIVGSHCIYESSELTLHFKKVSLNTKSVSRIHLQNTGRATAHVTCKIEDGNKGLFKVSPQSIDILPFTTKSLSIVFKPESVGESNSKLEISYNSLINNKFSLALIGEGLIPKVRVIEPQLVQNQCVLTFHPTYIGHSKSQRICIQNVASVPATAILEICDNIKEMLTLKAWEDTYDYLNICDMEEFQNTKSSTLVNLQPDQIANFDLIFEPNCKEDLKALIKVHTVNNSFEVVKITVNAESYYHDICLDGLTPYHDASKDVIGYEIDFGVCFLNYLQKKLFSIKNNSQEHTYKFEFTNCGPLIFTPKVGHLKPLTSKEIIVTFSSRDPQCFEKELVECTLNKIEYTSLPSEDLSWDERQKCHIFDMPCTFTNSKSTKSHETTLDEEEIQSLHDASDVIAKVKKIYDRPEPKFEIVPGTSEVILCLFSVIADYSYYVNEISEICFPDTCISEKKEAPFNVENNGSVPLEIEWEFLNNEIQQLNPASARDRNNRTSFVTINNDTVRSISATSLFSSECSCSCMEGRALPFTIIPQKTSIAPNKSQQFLVTFSPLYLSEYCVDLKSNITCLAPGLTNMVIRITGQSLVPKYYFEIGSSDYLSRRPHGVKMCGTPELTNSNIIEFESVGIDVPSIRKFNLVNPSKEIFTFKIESLEQYPLFSYFDCKTPSGFVLEGKKYEVIFIFQPQEFGNFEGYYVFQISETNIRVPFLLAGKCRQPSVYFTKTRISMKPTVLAVHSSITAVLRNDEDTDFSFKFLKETLSNEAQDQELEVSPKCGKLKPNSEQIIKFVFKAEKSGEVDFYIRCAVEKLPSPLTLNIVAQCTEVLSLITYCEKFDAMTTKSLNKDHENVINFGMIVPKKVEMIKFTISNIGCTGFFYTVQFCAKLIEHIFSFSVSQEKDFVPSNRKSDVTIYLEALKRATLKDFKVKINISYGPTYLLNINAKAETPLVKFSFNSYNFGHCIVQDKKTTYYNVSLQLKNVGTRVLLLENIYEDSDHLTVDFKCSQIRPSCSQHVTIYFHPLNEGHYKISVPFKVNSVKYVVKILGEAVHINLQLANATDKYIDLGGVVVGKAKQYVVEVINQTPTYVNVFFDLLQRLPFHSRPKEKLESDIKVPEEAIAARESILNKGKKKSKEETKKIEDKKVDKREPKKDNKKSNARESKGNIKTTTDANEKANNKGSKKSKKNENDKMADVKEKGKEKRKNEEENVIQDDILEIVEKFPTKKTAVDFLKISPRDCIQIGPEKKHKFVIEFTPTERIEKFSEQIFYEIQDHVEPLCVVRGHCISPNFVLSQDNLMFSNVVVGLKHTVNVLLRNVGDIKGRFQWVLEKGKDAFKINPQSGSVGSSSELEISVTFEPKVAVCVLKTTAKCLIAGLEKSLELVLEGSSTKIPTPLSTLYFKCPVRETTDENVKIVNTTKGQWKIHPMVSLDQFSMAREIIVDPDSEYILNITYKPETMTKLTPHNATLFLPLPEGKAIIYELIGQTLPPLPINKIKVDIKCKSNHKEVLPIRNWLNIKQCFTVKTELASTVTSKTLYKVSGNSLIELFPNETKGYNWHIYVINEIPLDFKVTFTNVETNEYMHYEISVNVLPPGLLQTINVLTCVRKPVDFTITLENPIDYPVTYTIDCEIPESTFDENVTVEPYSTHKLSLAYCPLKTDQITTHLNATCPELGTYTYCLNLVAKPPLPESTIKFKAELGDKVYKSVIWKNTFKTCVEFSAKFDHHVFSMEKISIAEGENGRLKFSFEPSELGVLQSKAIVFSPHTGNYMINWIFSKMYASNSNVQYALLPNSGRAHLCDSIGKYIVIYKKLSMTSYSEHVDCHLFSNASEYPLIGECVLPTPKGPYSIKPGGSTLISFLNPFMEDQTFNYYLQSRAFYLKQTSETIKAKKSTKIVVNLQALKNLDINLQSCQITAKLYVEVVDSRMDKIKWVYYLQSDI